MGLRTINLKLHNPSKIKRNILDTAFINYNNAFNYLLQKAHDDIDRIESDFKSSNGNYSTMRLSKWVDKALSNEINKFDIQPFKDSLKLDFGMILASYFVQKKTNPTMSFPNSHDRQRPIYFCRYDTKRCFCLLYDIENNKFFTKLFMLNTKNAKKRTNMNIDRKLKYISKNQEDIKCLKKETFIVVPLSFGKWQENMLNTAIDKPEILRTARLVKKNNDYYLSLSINLQDDEKVQVNSYLGVSRGIERTINFAIVDMNGNLMENGAIDCPDNSIASDMKNNICIVANRIVEIAIKNKSMVVLQNLIGKGDKLSWKEEDRIVKPLFGCKLYNDLARVLEYKLPQKGLPVPAKVSSVDIFSRCCICGNNTKKNRFSKTMFICTSCGSSYKLDILGSINLATKLIKYEHSKLKIKAKRTRDGMYLQNELIGLDLFISKNENPYDKIKEEINEILTKEDESKDINSIIEKLIKQDFANIEII